MSEVERNSYFVVKLVLILLVVEKSGDCSGVEKLVIGCQYSSFFINNSAVDICFVD
jgi:hypothetical protein